MQVVPKGARLVDTTRVKERRRGWQVEMGEWERKQ